MLKHWSIFQWWFAGLCTLFLMSRATCLPIQTVLDGNRLQELPVEQLAYYHADDDQDQEPARADPIPDFSVDVRQFAHMLSTHLMYDHLERAFYLVTKKISRRFRNVIQVDAMLLENAESQGSSPFDVYILKDQLKGAVGSFIEDRLPIVWNEHASALDRRSLQAYIEFVVQRLCPPYPAQDNNDDDDIIVVSAVDDNRFSKAELNRKTTTISNVCLEANSQQFLSSIDRYVGNHIQRTMTKVVLHELPILFESAMIQVKDILAHFNSNVLNPAGNQLKLVLTSERVGNIAKMDYSWINSREEMNEILDTVSHWETPMREDDGNKGENDVARRQGGKRLALAVHHFATLARV